MRFVVIGGGCYGTFYARQLLRAADAGAAQVDEILVVDRNEFPPARRDLADDPRLRFERRTWDDFLDEYFPALDPDSQDQLVPSPFTPHLALAWLLRCLESDHDRDWRLEPFQQMPGTPYQLQNDGGPLLLSHADWMCPVHCVEPAVCPHTRGPRDWDMADTAADLAGIVTRAGNRVDQVHLFRCHHMTHGVGTYRAADVPGALRQIRALDVAHRARIVVGTVSRCHGALNLLVADPGMDSVSVKRAASALDLPHFQRREP
jgi:hypothetical protein